MQSMQMAVEHPTVRTVLLCDGTGIFLLISGTHPADAYLHTDGRRPQ